NPSGPNGKKSVCCPHWLHGAETILDLLSINYGSEFDEEGFEEFFGGGTGGGELRFERVQNSGYSTHLVSVTGNSAGIAFAAVSATTRTRPLVTANWLSLAANLDCFAQWLSVVTRTILRVESR